MAIWNLACFIIIPPWVAYVMLDFMGIGFCRFFFKLAYFSENTVTCRRNFFCWEGCLGKFIRETRKGLLNLGLSIS